MLLSVKRHTAAALTIATLAAFGLVLPAAEAQTIERASNKSLTGAAYARLRALTYDQCEARCLKEPQCVAFEHYRGGGVIRRSANCALFSSNQGTRDSQYSDVGIKRQPVAAAGPAPKRSARPEATEGVRSGGSLAPPAPPARPAPPPVFAKKVTDADTAKEAQAKADKSRQEAEAAARTYRNGAKSAPVTSAAPSSEPRFGGGSPSTTTRSANPAPPPAAAPPTPAPVPGLATRSASPPAAIAPSTRAPSASLPPTSLPPTSPPPTIPPVASAPAAGPRAASPSAGGSAPGAPPTSTATRSVSPVAAAPAVPVVPAAAPEFHIVPIFYGTDRNRSDTPKRIVYANDRARRLEMGRALVTVPTNHKVPNIERPAAWNIPYFGKIWEEAEDPKKHFTIRQIDALPKAELLALIKQRLGGSEAFKGQSIVFIHGYNVGFDDALYRTAQISYDLQFDGASFAYSWPAGSGWASYPYARDSAQQAEPFLTEFLQMVQNDTGTTSISIVAHSMGNQMLLQVLRTLKQRGPAVSKINQIILAAPDVDRDAFEFLAAEIRGVARGITLYAAGNDVALEASRFLAGNQFRAGDVGPNGPVIVEGIDSIDISSVSTGYLAINHSNYAEHSELLTDLKQLIRTGTRPPELRIANYKRIQAAGGAYWRYQN